MRSDWEIKSRARSCAKTGRTFEDGEIFYTLLFRDGEGFRREDLCEAAWAERNENIQPFSHWRSRFEAPKAAEEQPAAKADVEDRLRGLIAERNPSNARAAFLLALLLERKKILRPIASDDASVLCYEHAKTGETFIIENPQLRLDQVAEVQQEVAEHLDGV